MDRWLEQLTGEKMPSQDLWEALRSGMVLCKAANAIRPGVIEKINDKPINGSVALMERVRLSALRSALICASRTTLSCTLLRARSSVCLQMISSL